MTPTTLQIYTTLDPLVEAAAEQIITFAEQAIAERGRFTMALSGGNTPKPVYETLAREQARLDWSNIHIFWGDERCVPPNHPESNYRMTHEALLQHIPVTCGGVHRLRGEIDPHKAAADYNDILRTVFSGSTPNPQPSAPAFDLILLGMGDDGHTASLFPHTAALRETEKWCVPNYVEKLGAWRLTFTPVLINAARQVIFLVAGAKKADPLYEVLRGAYQPEVYPSQLIKLSEGMMTYLVDSAAASRL